MTTGTYCAGPVDSSAPLSYYVTLKLSKVIGKLLLQVVPSLRSRLSVARNGGDMLEGLQAPATQASSPDTVDCSVSGIGLGHLSLKRRYCGFVKIICQVQDGLHSMSALDVGCC